MKSLPLLLILLCLAPLSPSFAGEAPAPLRVVVFAGNYPPFNIQQDGEIRGLGPDLCRAVLDYMEIDYSMRILPWKRAMHAVREGHADAVLSLFKTPERERILAFPEHPLFHESNNFFTSKRSGITYDGNLSSLKGFSIGVVDGYSYGPVIDNADDLNLYPSISDSKMVQMVLLQRYDLGIGNRYVVMHHAREQGLEDEMVILEPETTIAGAYVGFSRITGKDRLAARFSGALEAFSRTPAYERIFNTYRVLE